ncbi:MAG: TetR/AcrR family transcriptional regulator [Novosphingobium sp.]
MVKNLTSPEEEESAETEPAQDIHAADDASVNPSDATRLAILDAVVRCFAYQGWAGTNMSLVARETGMTRGKIQYYFPVLEDLKYAAIEHLHESSRRNYFEQISPDASPSDRFDMGINLMWQSANDPIHLAMAEVGAAARTDGELRLRLAQVRAADEEALNLQASESFPALAAVGHEEIQMGRLFTTIFINGLAAHSFPDDAVAWPPRMLAMLKECLVDFWTKRGVAGLRDGEFSGTDNVRASPAPPRTNDRATQARNEEALKLLQRAASLLAQD